MGSGNAMITCNDSVAKFLGRALVAAFLSSATAPAVYAEDRGPKANIQTSPSRDASANQPLKSIEVGDLLEYNRIIDPYTMPGVRPTFNFSPDGSQFLVATQKGDRKTRKVIFRLHLFDVAKTRDYLQGKLTDRRAVSREVMTWVVSEEMEHMGRRMRPPLLNTFRWSDDGSRIFFIGKEDKKPDQVYSLSIETGKVEQLTWRDRPVIAFYVSEKTNQLFGYELANTAVDEKTEETAVRADVKSLMEVACYRCDAHGVHTSMPQMFAQTLDGKPGGRVVVSHSSLNLYADQFWVSPDGQKAIVAAYPSAVKDWSEIYGFDTVHPHSGDDISDLSHAQLYMNQRMRPVLQYFIVDLETGKFQEITDAPAKIGFTGALWSPDSSRALVFGTYLPPDTGDAPGNQQRRKWPYIAEYSVAKRSVRPVYALAGTSIEPVDGTWPDLAQVLHDKMVVIPQRSRDRRNVKPVVIRWGGSGWQVSRGELPATDSDVQYQIRENLNSPPEVVVRDAATGKEKVLTDFNPQIRRLRMTRVEEFRWTDDQNVAWRGALIYPEGYVEGRRYPLVLEVRRYQPGGFIFGAQEKRSAPFVGRALASKGIMVLQMPAAPAGAGSGNLGRMLAAGQRGIESAVRRLTEAGYVDPAKVGVTGWSASGALVMNTVTFSETKFAAAIIADAMGVGMVNYANMFGFIAPGMNYSEEMLHGAQPWGDRLQDWVRNNPVFHLDRIETPLLIHGYVPGAVVGWWDIYAILRRLGKPVELWQYLDADHAPVKPNNFLHASEMAVDWYSFWLKGGGAARKGSEHHARWSEMKRYWDQSNPAGKVARQGQTIESSSANAKSAH